MIRTRLLLPLLLLSGLLLGGCTNRTAENEPTILTVAAAASLRDVLPPLIEAFERKNQDVVVRASFGSSGTLQNQIENGAPIDVFVAASSKNMDALEKSAKIAADSRQEFARGRLVLVAPPDSKLQSIADLKAKNVERIALGGPGVPAGDYARQALEFSNLALKSKLIFGKDVRAVLQLVKSGEADAGFVYRSDAQTAPEVRIVAEVPETAHQPIVYPIAVVQASKNAEAARQFVHFVVAQRDALKQQGFG